jgi:hypothetical protein
LTVCASKALLESKARMKKIFLIFVFIYFAFNWLPKKESF